MGKAVILGIGSLVVDQIFLRAYDGELYYQQLGGGGSVWNTLGRLALQDHETAAFGVAGMDWAGRLAAHALASWGVDTHGISFLSTGHTRVFTHIIEPFIAEDPDLAQGAFSTSCAVCGHTLTDLDLVHFAAASSKAALETPRAHLLLADRLNRESALIAGQARAKDLMTALDLGNFTALTAHPFAEIMTWLQCFQIVTMPWAVANYLRQRGAFNTITAWLSSIELNLVIVTRAKLGATLYGFCPNGSALQCTQAPAMDIAVKDSAGAGDALMAALLDNLLARSLGSNPRQILTLSLPEAQDLLHQLDCACREILTGIGARSDLPDPVNTCREIQPFDALRGLSLTCLKLRSSQAGHCLLCANPCD